MNNQTERAEGICAARGILIGLALALGIWTIAALCAVSAARGA